MVCCRSDWLTCGVVTRTERMSVSKVAGVYRHEKCSWYWLEKRMMAMTRGLVAVGQMEDEIRQQLHEDSPVVDICEGGRCERFVCFHCSVVGVRVTVVVEDSAASVVRLAHRKKVADG